MLTPSHCPQASTKGAPQGLWFLQWEKRSQGGHPASAVFPWGPLGSCLMGINGESTRLNHWGSDRDEERGRGRAFSNQSQDLGRLHSCLQLCLHWYPSRWLCPSSEPSRWPDLVRELGWQFCLIWVPVQQTMLTVEPILWPIWARKQAQSLA